MEQKELYLRFMCALYQEIPERRLEVLREIRGDLKFLSKAQFARKWHHFVKLEIEDIESCELRPRLNRWSYYRKSAGRYPPLNWLKRYRGRAEITKQRERVK